MITRRILTIFFSIVLSFFVSKHASAAASLFFTPSTGTYEVGSSFTIKVKVDSGGGNGIISGEGVIAYDGSVLAVTNVSKTGSIFTLWTTEPTYSGGKISYGGGFPPPPYKGTSGTILTITFKVLKAGSAKVSFASGAVMEFSPNPTNIAGSLGTASFDTKAKAPIEPKPEASKEEPKTEVKPEAKPDTKLEEKPADTGKKGILPPTPEIISSTHANDNEWYANNSPEFAWKLIADLSGLSFSLTDKLEDPATVSGIVETKKLENVKDGSWFFNLRLQNKTGWGQSAHKKVQVDVTPPNPISIVVDNQGDNTNPVPLLRFKTTDVTSGVDYYQMKLDGDSFKIPAKDVENNAYQSKPLTPGQHSISVAAFDMAKNSASSTATFYVEPLRSPVITDISKSLSTKEELSIRGASFYPNATIIIFIGKEGKDDKDAQQFNANTDGDGNWNYFHPKRFDKGNFDIWAKVVDSRGAESLPTSKHFLMVKSPSILEQFGWLIIAFLLMTIIIETLYILYLRKNFNEERERIRRESDEAKLKLTEIFTALREEVSELMELVDKKPGMSENERRVKEKIGEALDISEEFIDKELEDIKKEIGSAEKKE